MKAKVRIFAMLLAVVMAMLSPSLVLFALDGEGACSGEHPDFSSKGVCVSCGAKKDGVTSLYCNSLSLKDDIEVLFYFDIDANLAEGASLKIGLEKDFQNENMGF